jgi:hypothetical protein
MAKNDSQDAVVAARKSVDVDGKIYGPGETVTLPTADVVELRTKGFLVDPDADTAAADGAAPSVSISGGSEAAE